MAGGINQVEDVELTIGGFVFHPGRLELDRDAALPLQVHVVEELLLHVPCRHRAGGLQQAVGQGRFAVVDVGNDAEIANVFHPLGKSGEPVIINLFFGHNVLEPIKVYICIGRIIRVIARAVTVAITVAITIGFEIIKAVENSCKVFETIYPH